MLIKAPDDSVHFFLVGPRAPLGGVGPDSERVGTLVQRSRIDTAGALLDPGEVIVTDVVFDEAVADSPVRYEAEIALFKPEPDVAIVSNNPAPPPPPLPAPQNAFGSIEIRRAGQAGPWPNIDRNFDWLPRSEGPRLALAGQADPPPSDGSTLSEFDAVAFDLPRNYSDGFQNGQPVAGEDPFRTGDVIVFDQAAGPLRSVTIPQAPALAALDADGKPLTDPPSLDPVVDTVVLDIAENVFTLTWRTTFSWEDRFETATLEIAANG